MSLWLRTKDKQGRTHHVPVEVPVMSIIVIASWLMGILLPALAAGPLQVFVIFPSLLAAGFVCFAVAKLSVILCRCLCIFGSAG